MNFPEPGMQHVLRFFLHRRVLLRTFPSSAPAPSLLAKTVSQMFTDFGIERLIELIQIYNITGHCIQLVAGDQNDP